jgi:hypothetical protein
MEALHDSDALVLVASHLEPIYRELEPPYLEICSKTRNGFARGYKNCADSYPGFAAHPESLSELLILLSAKSYFENKMQVGLIHYRRIFSLSPQKEHSENTTMDLKNRFSIACLEAQSLHLYVDQIVIPKPLKLDLNLLAHFIECVPLLENAIYEACLVFDASVHDIFGIIDSKSELENTQYIYPWNMWIGSPDFYSEWVALLFPVLKALDNISDSLPNDGYQSRWSGFISERLFTVYINLCRGTNRWNFVERPVIFFEDAAVAERDSAVAERDSAVAERDSAVAERDSAVAERDSAVLGLERVFKSKSWTATGFLRVGDKSLRKLFLSPRE